jgi:alpha-L-fucosidase
MTLRPAALSAAVLVTLSAAAGVAFAQSDAPPGTAELTVEPPAPNKRAEWFREARFGVLLEWGPHATAAKSRPGLPAERAFDGARMPAADHDRAVAAFTAAKFDAAAVAALAKSAGARYVVLSARNPDGFCLWDSKAEPLNSAKTAAKRDLVAETAAAAGKAGLRFGVRFSLADGRTLPAKPDPAARIDALHAMLGELSVGYPLDGVWFDGEWTRTAAEWRAEEAVAALRKARPTAVVNDRLGREVRPGGDLPDFLTRDGEIPRETPRRANRFLAFETVLPIGLSAGYSESPEPLKSGERIIELLVETASKGGNLLLVVGPRPDGTIPDAVTDRLKVVGEFLAKNGEAIYGTDRSPFAGPLPAGPVTAKGNRLFLFADRLPAEGLALPGLLSPVRRATVLGGDGTELTISTKDGVTVVASPKAPSGPVFTVVVLELDGPPKTLVSD